MSNGRRRCKPYAPRKHSALLESVLDAIIIVKRIRRDYTGNIKAEKLFDDERRNLSGNLSRC